MTQETLHVTRREARGTKACRALRAEGLVPAVIYGHKEDPLAVQVPYDELEAALRHHSRMLELRIGRKKEQAILKEVQFDAFGAELVHADFLRVAMDETITIEIPIELRGALKQEHAILQQTLDNIEVECLPRNIPESFLGHISDLEIGDTLHVSDLEMPENVKVLTEPDTVVAAVTVAKAEALEEEEEAVPEVAAAEEPELIGREAGAEEAEEGAEPAGD